MIWAVEDARPEMASDMAEILNQIIGIGGTTAYRDPFDAARIRAEFITPPLGICCTAAVRARRIGGFQALLWADPDYPGPHTLPPDWAVIASYVAPHCQGTGIGRRLFDRTRDAARRAGVTQIDSTIRRENRGGLAYYCRLGFVTYREGAQAVSKCLAP